MCLQDWFLQNHHLSVTTYFWYLCQANTVMILSFQTDMPGQTVQTQIRSSLIRVYTVCQSVCIIWTHYSMVELHSSNFRVITTNFFGVRIFRKFTVHLAIPCISYLHPRFPLKPPFYHQESSDWSSSKQPKNHINIDCENNVFIILSFISYFLVNMSCFVNRQVNVSVNYCVGIVYCFYLIKILWKAFYHIWLTMYYVRSFLYDFINVSLWFSQCYFTKCIGYNTNCIGAVNNYIKSDGHH